MPLVPNCTSAAGHKGRPGKFHQVCAAAAPWPGTDTQHSDRGSKVSSSEYGRISRCEKCEAAMTDWCINSTLPAEVLEKIFKVLPRRDLKTAVSKTVRVDVMEKPH